MIDNDGYYIDVDDARDDYNGHSDFYHEREVSINKDLELYAKNKLARVGEKIMCASPLCRKKFIKKSYQQAFCCTKHKDQFWNRQRLI